MGGCSAGGGGSQGRGVGVGAYCYAVSGSVQFLPVVLPQACPVIMPLCPTRTAHTPNMYYTVSQ